MFVIQQRNGSALPAAQLQPVRKTQAERRAESEQALLQAAIDLIAGAGVGAVTFEALGKEGGFSRGLASVRFGNKARLIEAVLRHLHDRQAAQIRELGFDTLPGLDAVLGYVDHNMRNLATRPEARAYYMLLSSSVAEAGMARAGFAAVHAEVEARLRHWIIRGQAEGTIRAEIEAGAAALTIGCLMFGIAMQVMIDPDLDVEPLRTASLAMLKASIAAS